MKKTFVLVPLAVMLSYCGTSQKAGGGKSTASKRFVHTGKSTEADSVVVTGTQYIPVLGKNEAGVRADLQGTWVLQTMNGAAVGGMTSTATLKETYQANDKVKAGDMKRDTVVTKTKDGVTRTETSMVYMDDNRGNKITPPQGANYHIPEKPSLSFYGSNQTFSGFTGCNKISGRYTIGGANSISFSNASPSTKMVCIGDYDEETYLNTLRRVNSFKADNGQLQLMEGSKVLLVFGKK